ncbi:hypothetical protein EI94DRAFT_528649 [Lactarius quietus]|nr:hypothetical protein EI94DRAFT_528649 [Lactarius quietus]
MIGATPTFYDPEHDSQPHTQDYQHWIEQTQLVYPNPSSYPLQPSVSAPQPSVSEPRTQRQMQSQAPRHTNHYQFVASHHQVQAPQFLMPHNTAFSGILRTPPLVLGLLLHSDSLASRRIGCSNRALNITSRPHHRTIRSCSILGLQTPSSHTRPRPIISPRRWQLHLYLKELFIKTIYLTGLDRQSTFASTWSWRKHCCRLGYLPSESQTRGQARTG